MTERSITLIGDDGKEVKAEILFTYHSDEYDRNYVVFMVQGEPSAATYFDDGNGSGRLGDIETEDEWEMLNDLLEEFVENQKEGVCGGCCGCQGDCGQEGSGSDCSCGCKEN